MIAQSAARHYSKCILELGGKNPVIVDESANPKVAAMKIIAARLLNSGQTCISPDFVLVHEDLKGNTRCSKHNFKCFVVSFT